jgi:hypothetical protein
MTDIGGPAHPVPHRLGVAARFEDGALTLHLDPGPETLHHGVVRASVLSFMIDAAAVISVDDDKDAWTMTHRVERKVAVLQMSYCMVSTARAPRASTCSISRREYLLDLKIVAQLMKNYRAPKRLLTSLDGRSSHSPSPVCAQVGEDIPMAIREMMIVRSGSR